MVSLSRLRITEEDFQEPTTSSLPMIMEQHLVLCKKVVGDFQIIPTDKVPRPSLEQSLPTHCLISVGRAAYLPNGSHRLLERIMAEDSISIVTVRASRIVRYPFKDVLACSGCINITNTSPSYACSLRVLAH